MNRYQDRLRIGKVTVDLCHYAHEGGLIEVQMTMVVDSGKGAEVIGVNHTVNPCDHESVFDFIFERIRKECMTVLKDYLNKSAEPRSTLVRLKEKKNDTD